MTAFLLQRVEQQLNQRKESGLYRSLTNCSLSESELYQGDDRQPYINFSGNDYLGLAQTSELKRAWQQGIEHYGAGSTASPLVVGRSPAHEALEETLCDWQGYPRALLFSSGFAANQAVIFSLMQKGDLLLQDKLNHASLMEAGILSEAELRRYHHNNMCSLEKLCKKRDNQSGVLVATDGVFSMDGDLAPLSEIDNLCRANGAMLMVDDAHGCGVLGDDGAGSSALKNIKPDILVLTFGKAFGLMGAAVLCSESIANYLTQFARHFVYSTAIPPGQAHAISHALTLIRQQVWRREKLAELSDTFHRNLSDFSDRIPETITPIKPVIFGDTERTLKVAENLKQSGFWVGAIRPPTVPPKTARLRVTLSASHSVKQVNALTEQIKRNMQEEL
ncbi:8-amino-7-oxononanoate synthase [Veronia pacifica]|uniref:8-amino-7-oxononanoate synthase n=1 Tax=Veronia pacifica TaxID=1080227 RepID=A0A1C3EPV5_9GAMM|nr:8-amino-7-oxononanoate synthase [Veronia pacifica]ODA35265.1 8-amino-7-oxononanoate synthase [Veronia pacifica]